MLRGSPPFLMRTACCVILGVFQAIEAKGFALVQFEDSVSFRFDYESRFRSKWDAGRPLELVVYFKPEEREFETLPADVVANAQRLSFTLKDVFSKLSYIPWSLNWKLSTSMPFIAPNSNMPHKSWGMR